MADIPPHESGQPFVALRHPYRARVMRPDFGDVVILSAPGGEYDVVDALTLNRVANGKYLTLAAAHAVARAKGGRIWEQALDSRGRPRGVPVPVRQPV